ncbi:hypothetical protein LP7551_04108 [Roseibium album]|nr:hypothetical protein LP7551_04108 [Roseibium album]
MWLGCITAKGRNAPKLPTRLEERFSPFGFQEAKTWVLSCKG